MQAVGPRVHALGHRKARNKEATPPPAADLGKDDVSQLLQRLLQPRIDGGRGRRLTSHGLGHIGGNTVSLALLSHGGGSDWTRGGSGAPGAIEVPWPC